MLDALSISVLDEARAIAARLGAPLYKAVLRAAIARAEQGDPSDLAEALPRARRQLERQEAASAAWEAAEHQRIAAFAEGKDPTALAKEHAKLQREQERDYARWGQRRPDERTARKARLSNRLDGRARLMALLSDAHEQLTGRRL